MRDVNKQYIIYAHINKFNGKMYIGQTSTAPEVRWKYGKGYIGNQYFYNAIKKYGWNGFDHIIIAQGLTLEEANKYEEFLIAKYKTNNKEYGYNIREGGRNSTMNPESKKKISESKMGHSVSDETREKISRNHADMSGKNNPMYGRHHSEETKEKIRQRNQSIERKGVKRSPETIQKMKENHQDFSGDKNPRARAVIQLTVDEQYIKTFSTAKEAADSIGQSGNNITVCCRKHNRTAGGYKWRYADEYCEQLCSVPSA